MTTKTRTQITSGMEQIGMVYFINRKRYAVKCTPTQLVENLIAMNTMGIKTVQIYNLINMNVIGFVKNGKANFSNNVWNMLAHYTEGSVL